MGFFGDLFGFGDNTVHDPFGYEDPLGPHCCGCEAGQHDDPRTAIGNPSHCNSQDDERRPLF